MPAPDLRFDTAFVRDPVAQGPGITTPSGWYWVATDDPDEVFGPFPNEPAAVAHANDYFDAREQVQ